MERYTVKDLQNMLRDNSISGQELNQIYFDRIKILDNSINAFIQSEGDPIS